MKQFIEYNIGLDVGSDSIGWSVIDGNGNFLIPFGVRLFKNKNGIRIGGSKDPSRRKEQTNQEILKTIK